MQARRLEVWAYVRCDQWKRTYRHTLVNDFRKHITDAKNEIIRAFELPNKMRNEKAYHYNAATIRRGYTKTDYYKREYKELKHMLAA